MLTIAAVERDTGLSKDSLRVWERRYGFPMPERDAQGERVYSAEQLAQLRLIKRLLDMGLRPGKIVGQSLADLQALSLTLQNRPAVVARGRGRPKASDAAVPMPIALQPRLPELLLALREHRSESLQQALRALLTEYGLARFVMEVAAPLTYEVGEAWGRGEIEVFEEHLFTEQLTLVLRSATAGLNQDIARQAQRATRRPRILLTTFPGEPHGLGLLMAEALMVLESCAGISLGVQTPLTDIVRAAETQQADIVALSFSVMQNSTQMLEGLATLRASLPADVEIWAGGANAVLRRRPPADVLVLQGLAGIATQIATWRAAHPE